MAVRIGAFRRYLREMRQLMDRSAQQAAAQIALLDRQATLLTQQAEVLGRQTELLERLCRRTEEQTAVTKKVQGDLQRARGILDNQRHAVMTPIMDQVRAAVQPRQLGLLETLTTIRDEGLSFARFGDGEFKLLMRLDYNAKFQANSPALQDALRSVIEEPREGVLVGMPNIFTDLFWTNAWAEVWSTVLPLIGAHERFGNSHVSRPLVFQVFGEEGAEVWQSLWRGRNVLVVTGQGSRFDLIDPLFGSVASVDRLDSRPEGAFADVPELVERVLGHPADLVLVSLGPAGTVLAAELGRRGKQTIDLGHLTSSYNYVFDGRPLPESTPQVRPMT